MNTLEEGFRLLASGCAMSYGYSFSAKCELDLHQMIHEGTSSLLSQGPPLPIKIKKAQDNLVYIAFNLVIEAKRTHKPEIEEIVFEKIRKALCPLPPWIKAPCPK